MGQDVGATSVATGEIAMFRKLILVLGATVAIGTAALTPTTASAWGWGHHWGHHWGYWGHGYGGIYAPIYATAPGCYVVRRVVDTPVGPRVRRFTVCD
jgi:hypothetical protein